MARQFAYWIWKNTLMGFCWHYCWNSTHKGGIVCIINFSAILVSDKYVLFIDEIHTIIGAGSSEGGLDVANILKPVLSRGDISVIGATTKEEYDR